MCNLLMTLFVQSDKILMSITAPQFLGQDVMNVNRLVRQQQLTTDFTLKPSFLRNGVFGCTPDLLTSRSTSFL
jgi:hypothetical protein